MAPRRASDSEVTISAVSNIHKVKCETDYSFGTNVSAVSDIHKVKRETDYDIHEVKRETSERKVGS